MATIDVTDATIEAEVLKSELPVLVDFWAPWCGPCKHIAPIIDSLAADYAGRVKFAKVNVDEAQRSAQAFGIQSIPTLLLIHQQRLVDRISGAADRKAIEEMLAKVAQPDASAPEKWDADRAKLALEAGLATPVDLREEGPFRSAHIPGARNAPPVDEGERFAHLDPASGRYLLYGRTDEGVDEIAREAAEAGFKVAVLKEGMIGWELAQGPVEKSLPPN